MTVNLRTPSELSVTDLDIVSFDLYMEGYNNFRTISKVYQSSTVKIDDKTEISMFLHIAGLEILNLVSALKHDGTFKGVIESIRQYLKPITNVTVERHNFFSMTQSETETVQQYMVRLKKQIQMCNFTDTEVDTIENQLLRDQFIRGVSSNHIRQKLLQETSLQLLKCEQIANSVVSAETDTKIIQNRTENVFYVTNKNNFNNKNYKHQNRSYSPRSFSPRNRSNSNSSEMKQCFTCNRKGHLSKDCYKNAKCQKCHKIGHTSSHCGKFTNRKNVQKDKNSVMSLGEKGSQLNFIEASFNGYSAKFLVDTGSTLSLINKNFVQKHNLYYLMQNCTLNAKAANGENLSFTHYVNGILNYKDSKHAISLYITNTIDFEGIIGMDLISKLGLQVGPDPQIILSLASDIVKEFASIFNKPLKDAKLTEIPPFEIIQTEPNVEPYRCSVRNISKNDLPFVQEKIKELLDNGVIRVSQSPWRHQPIVVPKDNGAGKRLVLNYKPVNSVTVFDAYPLPCIQEIFEDIGDSTWFSKIDFTQFYHQLPLAESDIPKTAFFANGELYEYTCCPFGLKNAVAYCTRILKLVLKDCKGVSIYLDDVLIHGKTRAEHDANLREVLNRIKKHGLGLNVKKCVFAKQEISYLGFIIKDGYKKPDPIRYESILNFPKPDSAKSLQRFLGMIGFFSNYIDHYSDIVKPLYDKLSNFDEWSEIEISNFELLKTSLTKAVLYIPSSTEKLKLHTDASGSCISGVLLNEKNQPVQFCSRKLNEAELRYDIVEKEALAIYWTILKCRSFLLCRKFEVYSDHKPLQFIFSNEKASMKVIRWRLQLQQFNFSVIYLKGGLNVVADCFSRINCIEDKPIVITEEEILAKQKQCREISAFKLALTKNYMNSPSGVSIDLWSSKSSSSIENDIVFVSGKILVPYSLRLKILTFAHGCHLGPDATFQMIHQNYYWPCLRKEVNKFIETCRICSLTKPKFYDPKLNPLIVKSPFECLAADFVGPLPNSRGYRYLLVVIDMYSRYPFVFPTRNMETATVIPCFQTIFSQYGYPNSILTDRGGTFESREFALFCANRGITKKTTSAYNPKGNSICERFNQTLKRNIFKLLTDSNTPRFQWTTKLEYAVFSYRTTIHSTHGFRPVDLFLSFNVRSSLPFRKNGNTNNALPNMIKNRYSAKTYYDKQRKVRFMQFHSGEQALLKNPINTGPFTPKGTVVEIVKQLTDETVEIVTKHGKDTVNISRLSKLPKDSKEGFNLKNSSSVTISNDQNGRNSGNQRNGYTFSNGDRNGKVNGSLQVYDDDTMHVNRENGTLYGNGSDGNNGFIRGDMAVRNGRIIEH